jgi:hypothetical protein
MMFARSCYSWIRGSATKWSSVWLTFFFVLVFLLAPSALIVLPLCFRPWSESENGPFD